MDITEAKRMLGARHNELRDRGLNPLEALAALVTDMKDGGAGLTEEAHAPVMAAAFQSFLSHDLRGAFGQYLTPAVVADHVADLAARLTGAGAAPVVVDPFGGTGILLEAVGRELPHAKLRAAEINEPVAAVCEAMAGLCDLGIEVTLGDAFDLWQRGLLPDADVVVTNPPFGASLTTESATHLADEALGGVLSRVSKVPVELASLELCAGLLSEGGLLVSVLPLSVLTNGGYYDQFRSAFFAENTPVHVTILPEETFAPFRGVARACVLVTRRARGPVSGSGFVVFTPMSVGYDDTGRPTGDSDLGSGDPELVRTGSVSSEGVVTLWETADMEGSLRLGDIAEVFRGANPAREQYQTNGPFLLKVGGLSGSFISWRERDRSRVPEDWYAKRGARVLRLGDVVLTATAHKPRYIAAKVDLVDELPPGGAAASGELIVIRLGDDSPLTPVELLYALRSAPVRAQVHAMIRGSTAHVYPKDLVDLRLPAPWPRRKQKAVQAKHAEAASHYRAYLRAEAEAEAEAASGGESRQGG